MREIKYKAWDTDNKVIITPSLYDIGIYLENRTINSIFTDDRVKFIEYTGLKDKNGVEIYEGYIVYDRRNNKYGEIKYNDKMGRFSIYWSNWSRMNEFHGEAMNSWVYPIISIEVKGNIYQDKNLI